MRLVATMHHWQAARVSNIAVVGVGAIGGVVAARLCAAGRDVVLCVRRQFDELLLEGPDGTLKVTPPVVTSPGNVGPVGWICWRRRLIRRLVPPRGSEPLLRHARGS